MTAGSCPGCGGRPGHHQLFCSSCWVQVPRKARQELQAAWSAYRRRPSSTAGRTSYEQAVAAAASHVRS